MGRIGKVLADLLIIDDWLSLLTFIVALIVLVGVVGLAIFWPLWHFLVRPVAAARGLVPLTGYDYLVRAWQAERRGDWVEALKTYDRCAELFPAYREAHERREALVAAHPELTSKFT